MHISSFQFRGHSCFKTEWAGFEEIKPVNVIIGRNNTGKSQLLELVKSACDGLGTLPAGWELRLRGVLDEASVLRLFPRESGANQKASLWDRHGSRLVGLPVVWERAGTVVTRNLALPSITEAAKDALFADEDVHQRIVSIVSDAYTPLASYEFRHLFADRDIQPELYEEAIELRENGQGATNLIRKVINSSSQPGELVQTDVLNALNRIFGGDGEFTAIHVRHHDAVSGEKNNKWEVYLAEAGKGQVALSSSGSGLKTILLVLLNLLVIPALSKKSSERFVFAFEELENNLHPALLRRLLRFIEEFALQSRCLIFLTTHSSVALDMFGLSEHAQLVHVTHDRKTARAEIVRAHFERAGVVSELGAKPSDILQANGVVWVEGPSDVVLVSRWIELKSNGELKLGRDYACAFYGGGLLAHVRAKAPEIDANELMNIIHLNVNVAMVCDSDRRAPADELKERVRRIREELKLAGAFVWVTMPKEIEGYLPAVVIGEALGKHVVGRDPAEFDKIFASSPPKNDSYFEEVFGSSWVDKVQLANACAEIMTLESMSGRFDWDAQVSGLVATIRKWNE